jgi:methionine sulfoxide reductase heme-binding subunit
MRMILNNKYIFWALLAVPALLLLAAFGTGARDSMDMLHPSGEWSARLMLFAIALSPLSQLLGRRSWLQWLIDRRRAVGVASFFYAVMHLAFYIIDMGTVDDMAAEFLAPGIWTAWAAFALLLPVAISSNFILQRRLKRGWKIVQRLVYPAAILTFLHWVWVHNNSAAALAHFIPLVLIVSARWALPFFPRKTIGV